ncbi:MAG TPA: hypothetical protein PK733_07895 [Clostridiales bacterium]|nr:hypothetical protein [Clostridiales bacterium]
MYNINKIIDFSTWTGNWPFIHLKNSGLDDLKKKLKSQNVIKAFVSPIESILERDPMRADKQLLQDIKDDFFSPVPVVDLSYANWEKVVELAIQDKRVKMIKLIPNYHIYELSEEKLEKLVNLTMYNKLIIAIQMRIEDTRGQYPLMKIPDVDMLSTIRALSNFPQQAFILNNVYWGEVAPALHSTSNVYIDISSVECPNVLHTIRDAYSLDKILFSSHSAFYYPEGNVFKLNYSDLDVSEIEKVAYRNGEILLNSL